MPGFYIFGADIWYQKNKLVLAAIWSLELQQGARKYLSPFL
jgi:hypothetical protein